MFKVPKSHHSKQRELDARSHLQRLMIGVGGLFIGLAILASWLIVFPRMLVPFVDLISRQALVNIHFQGYFLGGNFAGIGMAMMGAAVLFYGRPLIPAEMKIFWRRLFYFSMIGGVVCMFSLGATLTISSYIVANVNGYSRCQEASNASQWDSYWALDQRSCPMVSQN